MKRVLLSKSAAARREFVQCLADSAPGPVIHIRPKNTTAADINGFCTTYEALNDSTVWADLNARLGESTIVILENPSRYPKISSPKFKMLSVLSRRCKQIFVTDIVPFTLETKYLYTLYSHVGREVLGYQHWYAFRESYQEITPDGRVVSGHDPALLANKVASVTTIDYAQFSVANRTTINPVSSNDEAEKYQALRTELFDSDTTPPRMVTKLADLTHAFVSRYAAVLDHAAGLQGSVLIYSNLNSYAKRYTAQAKALGLSNVQATSYQLGTRRVADHLIYAEAPIVKSYFLLDAEATNHAAKSVTHVLGDMKVDHWLHSLIFTELEQLDALTVEIAHATGQ